MIPVDRAVTLFLRQGERVPSEPALAIGSDGGSPWADEIGA